MAGFQARVPDIHLVGISMLTFMRYLNLADRNGRVVWCDYQTDVGVVERDVAAGFRYARSS